MKRFVVADTTPAWFREMTKEQQDKYLEDHPNSKLAKTLRKSKSIMPTAPKAKDEIKPSKPLPAQELLEKKGSPTNFKGPTSKQNSISDNPKKERRIVAMLDKLAAMVKDAKEKGKDAPDYDLCKVSIPGTNLFCNGNKGIPRKEMPQLKGQPVEGSWADKNLSKDKSGEVNGEDAFKAMLKEKGIKLTSKKADVSTLKATQSQLVGPKIAGMFQALKQKPNHEAITAPIFVSKDGYILDGHHRWAAMVALDMADGLKQPIEMPVVEVDMEIEDLVKATNDFCNEVGIAQKAGKVKEQSSCDDCGLNLQLTKAYLEEADAAKEAKLKALRNRVKQLRKQKESALIRFNSQIEALRNQITRLTGD